MTAVPVLSVRAGAFGYAERPIVSDVDLQLHRGEVLAVLGANGSGKSTLVKGLLGLATRYAGSVDFYGHPLAALPDRWRIGYVPQRHTLAGTVRATVSEVVSCGRLPRRRLRSMATVLPSAASRATDRAAIEGALELVGMADRARVDVTALSGGQQRRVLIARALAGEPQLLLMDEPLAGVDPVAQHELATVLARLVKAGMTLVVVTHELVAMADLVTRVVVLDQGRITFDGPRAQFEAAQGRLLHDHGHHHHPDEAMIDQAPGGSPSVVPIGPGPLSAGPVHGGPDAG